MTDVGVMIGRAIIIVPLGILVLAAAIGGGAPVNERSSNETPTIKAGRGDYGLATKTVAAHMFDPEAVRFQGVAHTGLCDNAVYVGGEMNAKNRFGGYTGYKTFVVKVQEDHTILFADGKALASDLEINKATQCMNQAAAEAERSRTK